MLALLAGFMEKEIFGSFTVASATASGLAMAIQNSDNSPLNPSPYGNFFGTIAPATVTQTFVQSGTTPFAVTEVSVSGREAGWLLQPVTSSGPALLNILAEVYDESVAAGGVAALALSKSGALIATDQYSTGTGAISFGGAVALGTTCGINAGQPRVLQAGDAPRLIFMGKVVQRGTITMATFQII